MKRKYDFLHTIILISFLIVACFIENAIIKGILLLLFSSVLFGNTVIKLITKKNDKLSVKFFYGVLLFLDTILTVVSIYVIVTAVA